MHQGGGGLGTAAARSSAAGAYGTGSMPRSAPAVQRPTFAQ